MRKVLIFGTFDRLHEGHADFFRQARAYGDHLAVVVGRDATVEMVKKRLPKYSEMQRLTEVQNCVLVDEARLGNEGSDPYKIIAEINPDVICLGYDQTHFTEKLEAKLQEMGMGHVKIHRLQPYKPEMYHSSLLHNQHVRH